MGPAFCESAVNKTISPLFSLWSSLKLMLRMDPHLVFKVFLRASYFCSGKLFLRACVKFLVIF